MLKLPKVLKDAGRALTPKETAKAAVFSAALALGITLSGLPAQDVQASTASMGQTVPQAPEAAMLLLPAGQTANTHAAHQSHESHSSHSSHASHASHYSSRP